MNLATYKGPKSNGKLLGIPDLKYLDGDELDFKDCK